VGKFISKLNKEKPKKLFSNTTTHVKHQIITTLLTSGARSQICIVIKRLQLKRKRLRKMFFLALLANFFVSSAPLALAFTL